MSVCLSAHLGLRGMLLLRAHSLLCSSSLGLVDALVVFGQQCVRGCGGFFSATKVNAAVANVCVLLLLQAWARGTSKAAQVAWVDLAWVAAAQ